MPRKSRIRLLGKWEEREARARAEEMRRLAGTLRREWRQGRAAQAMEDAGGEAREPNDQLRAVR